MLSFVLMIVMVLFLLVVKEGWDLNHGEIPVRVIVIILYSIVCTEWLTSIM